MATADTAEEVIELFCNSSWYNRFDREVFYVTTKVRKDVFLKYNNRVIRGGCVYSFEWKDQKGGIWQIIGTSEIKCLL